MSTAQDQFPSAAVSALYAAHADELRALLLGVLRNADLAAEALQSTFVKVAEDGSLAREETRKSWLFTVAMNEARLLKRKQKRERESLEKAAAGGRFGSEGTDDDHSPESGLVQAELVERVRGGLDRLPPEQRAVVRMRIYDEKTFAVIATELNLPLGTVLTRMRLALKRLEQSLRPDS